MFLNRLIKALVGASPGRASRCLIIEAYGCDKSQELLLIQFAILVSVKEAQDLTGVHVQTDVLKLLSQVVF